ncbi:endonuclease MutS2 [Clostridium sp. YIM B02515]|uniref:Endonuclease MutS2 n=1 Tax=Clostridium rhizosphaerae TaxID=2803861 RepID=A0ABS1TDH3_9CLOT|nr:endonuclease MutS2 [Clostridium rhizosphaerae]MBL4937286.1 endonuclease MutS2 [Clostridium rhizosphaerae]
MNKNTINILEYNKIKESIKNYALSEIAKDMVDKLEPSIDINIIEKNLKETTEARNIVDRSSSVPLHGLTGIKNIKDKLGKGGNLTPEEFETVCGLLMDGKRLKRFMADKVDTAPNVGTYALSISELSEVVEEIARCIYKGRVDDRASSELSRLRKKIAILEDRVKNKLESFLKNPKYKDYIQDSLVSMRNGRYVIPIKNQYKNNVEGSVHDMSSRGSTVFVEPAEVKKAQDELNMLRIEEEKEVYRILSSLTAMLEDRERELSINIETMSYYDFLFAKAKYSKSIDGRAVKLNNRKFILIKNGRHPLIGKDAIPLNFTIGDAYKSLVITGPNTGGKTVVLKTVGLLTMMVQSGLHVPVDEGSEFAVFADILADIGDGQSIEQSLSTFSSHIKNIISIINSSDEHTLVIIDEVGSGTDPGEGMGIAAAVLEEIHKRRATMLATTHYSEIKDFAKNTPGFINGCMEFDINTLKPLYKLSIGKAGESNALFIALRLGMDKALIERAHKITYKETKEYTEYKPEVIEYAKASDEIVKQHKEVVEKFKASDKAKQVLENKKLNSKFNLGDCVYISSINRTGIVCELENNKGEIGVMVMKNKFKINHKRLSLFIEGQELYPEDYDFDIVFESKENRKKNKLMNKKHVEGIQIETNK